MFIKSTVNSNSAKAVNTLNNNLGGYSFGTTADGQPGYRKPGADTVTPFSNTKIITRTVNGNNTRTVSVSFADLANYKKLTIDNFAIKSCNVDVYSTIANVNNRIIPNLKYNSSTGVLTLDSGNTNGIFNAGATVVCFY